MLESLPLRSGTSVCTTLFELISAVAESADSDAETVAVVTHLAASGSLRAPRRAPRRALRGAEKKPCGTPAS
jgi:hypothetical protein